MFPLRNVRNQVMSPCLCFASQRGSSPVISFISPRRQLPRRKRFPPKRQIAPDAESARPDAVWKSRAFLTLAAERQCQKKEQSSRDSHKIALPTPAHTSVLLCARVGGCCRWLTSCQARFGSKCLDTLPNEPIVCSGGVPLGGPRRRRKRRGTKGVGSVTMRRTPKRR